MTRPHPMIWFGAALFWLLGLAYCARAEAHEHWIAWGGYVDPQHPTVHCCGAGDCGELSADDVVSTPAGWLIKSLGEVVPYSEAYSSEDGKFWRCRRPADGTRRCFFAPQGSS